jgi:hypothetical protein
VTERPSTVRAAIDAYHDSWAHDALLPMGLCC